MANRKLKIFEYPNEHRQSVLVAAPTLKDAQDAVGPEVRQLPIEEAYALVAEAYMVEIVGFKHKYAGLMAKAGHFSYRAEQEELAH